MDKREIRKKFKEIRKNLRGNITEDFFESDIYVKAGKIFTFVSYGSEINTCTIIKKAFEDKKEVAVPYMTGKPHEMVFLKINSFDELKPNKMGIPEPEYNRENIMISDKNTLVIVPGLAFDSEFYRTGYGGGYYDKYLSENEYAIAAGVCFEEQITDRVPRDEYDVKMDVIVTDRRILRRI